LKLDTVYNFIRTCKIKVRHNVTIGAYYDFIPTAVSQEISTQEGLPNISHSFLLKDVVQFLVRRRIYEPGFCIVFVLHPQL